MMRDKANYRAANAGAMIDSRRVGVNPARPAKSLPPAALARVFTAHEVGFYPIGPFQDLSMVLARV